MKLNVTTLYCGDCRLLWQEHRDEGITVVNKHSLRCPRCATLGTGIALDPPKAKLAPEPTPPMRGFGDCFPENNHHAFDNGPTCKCGALPNTSLPPGSIGFDNSRRPKGLDPGAVEDAYPHGNRGLEPLRTSPMQPETRPGRSDREDPRWVAQGGKEFTD
jgi:hypothetical protein